MSDVAHMDLPSMLNIIAGLGKAPDSQLATVLAQQCTHLVQQEPSLPEVVDFLRNLRDQAVHSGGASSFVLTTIAVIVDRHEFYETPECKAERRVALAKKLGIQYG